MRPKQGPIAERLGILLEVFSRWDGISLTYRQFAAEIGAPVTEAAVKKWPQRKKFPADAARQIVTNARDRGLVGVTLDWVLWGDGTRPQKAPIESRNRPIEQRSPLAARTPEAGLGPAAIGPEPHGRFAERIAAALQADLRHNEFGQWSSVEVQHTGTWALNDLPRRRRRSPATACDGPGSFGDQGPGVPLEGRQPRWSTPRACGGAPTCLAGPPRRCASRSL